MHICIPRKEGPPLDPWRSEEASGARGDSDFTRLKKIYLDRVSRTRTRAGAVSTCPRSTAVQQCIAALCSNACIFRARSRMHGGHCVARVLVNYNSARAARHVRIRRSWWLYLDMATWMHVGQARMANLITTRAAANPSKVGIENRMLWSSRFESTESEKRINESIS